jgi:hypothetical protein
VRSQRGSHPLRGCLAAGLLGLALLVSFGTPAGAAPQATAQSGCPSAACTSVLAAVAAGTHVTSVPASLTPSLQNAGSDILTPPDDSLLCGGGMSTTTLPQCQPEGSNPSAPRIALVGDSEAQTWSISMDALARRTGYSFLPLAKTECTMADLLTQVPYSKGPYTSCPAFRKWAFAQIAAFKPSILVISTLAEQFNTVKGKPISPSAYTTALEKTIHSLQTPGRQIVVISDPPHQLEAPPICLAAHESNFKGCETTLPEARKYDGVWQSALQTAAAKTGATFINVTPWFCDKNSCPLVVQNTEVYLDYGHMTSTYGVFLSGVLQAALKMTNACTSTTTACNTYSPVPQRSNYTAAELASLGKG